MACDLHKLKWLMDKPASAFRAKVKIYYNSPGIGAMVCPRADGAIVDFDEPVSAITPGQLAVFYVEDQLGGRVAGAADGLIERATKRQGFLTGLTGLEFLI